MFSINRAFGVGRDAKAFLNMQGGLTRGEVPNPEHHEEQARRLRKIVTRQRKALRRKDQQIEEQAVTLETLRERRQREIRLRKELKETRLEIFHLNNELDAMKALVENAGDVPSAEQVSGEPEVGALPDFVIIGAQKGGTSFLYHLLTLHPLVEPAARKELHFFDNPELFDHGAEWYRRCFPRLNSEGRAEVHDRRGDSLLPVRSARRKEDGADSPASAADSVAQESDRQGLLPLPDAGKEGNRA